MMALSDIVDILDGFPGWTTDFRLMRRDQTARSQGGSTIVKRRNTPLWTLTAQTISLRPNDLDRWRARMEALEDASRLFWGYSMSRCYPILYPNGSWPTGPAFNGLTATINTLNANNKAMTLAGVPEGYKPSEGDMLSFQYGPDPSYALHRIEETVTASAGGVTPEFEVRPHIRPGAVVGTAVRLVRPRCLMMIVPGSVSAPADLNTGRGTVSFQGLQVL
ncbi:hypothetical protein C5748_17100 [Phyllobacterium phragmitis]|uniref:Uncharacterized protein n=1 Tax=Phyllobacterium phragmitis TaxID=2670329 RepID=A0A2S9INW3_9HYPH|nr:hypothetical protein [Phyllobacterium phragmitis]PRD42182.1 hypothetical protein C5748_17100 [Phyllobacterium phragmitis]